MAFHRCIFTYLLNFVVVLLCVTVRMLNTVVERFIGTVYCCAAQVSAAERQGICRCCHYCHVPWTVV